MKQPSYRDRDYPFGQLMLTLRSTLNLTQIGLADFLGVSRRSIVDWESGSKYPKADHLKHLIALALERGAFFAGHEQEEIRALWQAAHQKLLLDEAWLAALLALLPSAPPSVSPSTTASATSIGSASAPRLDWGDALSVPSFYGRDWELSLLAEWVVQDRCQVVSVLGLGGIGKSSLVVRLMHQVASQFEVVIWRSLRDAPTCESLLDDCLQVIHSQPLGQAPASFEQRLSLLQDNLRSTRILLVLDNLEVLLEEGEGLGQMRPGYEGFARLLRQIAETQHQSCLLLTSREKPETLLTFESSRAPVRALHLARLDTEACSQLLSEKDVTGSDGERAQLIDAYTGNPLALKIVAQTIADLFEGEIAPFLEQGEVIFGGVRQLLGEQFARLSPLEQSLLIWLAILREPATLDDLLAVLVRPVPRARLLEAVEALRRRSLLERGQARATFTLQSVVLEYATGRLIARAGEEIEQGQLDRLVDYGLELAQSREYVRQTQERLIAQPILASLRGVYPQAAALETQLRALLTRLSDQPSELQGYAPANLVVLLRLLRGDLRGVDLSHLSLRGLYLQGVNMQDSRLVNATLRDSLFTQIFDAMTCVAISRTGEYWAASSRRGEIRIWEAGGNLLRQAWRAHTDMIWGITFSPDGQLLASSGWDGRVNLWEVTTGRLLWSRRHASFANSVAFSPDGRVLASSGNDALVHLWQVDTGALLQTLPHSSSVPITIWSPDGYLFVTGDAVNCIRVWALNQTEPMTPPRLLRVMEHDPKGYIDGLSFSPDGNTLASASWDSTVRLWDITSGRELHRLTGHVDRAGRVVWSPDGRTLATSGYGEMILLWDVEQARYRGSLRGHTEDVYQIAFTPDSRSLLSGSRDGTLRVWDVETEQCVRVIQGYAASIYAVDWSPDGAQLVSGGTDLVTTFWDVQTGTPLRSLQEHIGIVTDVAWSPDGRWLASAETEHAIRLWDLKSNDALVFLRPADRGGNYYYSLTWSPDARHLAAGSPHGGVIVWEVMTGEQGWIGGQSSIRFPHLAWSPDGIHLAAGGDDGIVYIWNVAEDLLEQCLIGHQSLVKSLAWSPDGALLASGTGSARGGELFVWNVASGERLHSLVGHSGVVSAVAWDARGERLISGGGEGRIYRWDVRTGECLRWHEAHQGNVQSLKRSSDGTQLASCGDDGAIMLWDLDTGEHLQTLRRDRPYERLNITGIRGLSEIQKASLLALGAIEDRP